MVRTPAPHTVVTKPTLPRARATGYWRRATGSGKITRLPTHRAWFSSVASRAEVAELADAHGSGPCTRKGVGVRVPSSAPNSLLERFLNNPRTTPLNFQLPQLIPFTAHPAVAREIPLPETASLPYIH